MPRDGFALTATGGFAEFARIAADVLKGLRLQDKAVEHVLSGLAGLRVHPDVPDGMRSLHEAGIRLFTVTNGSAAMTAGILRRDDRGHPAPRGDRRGVPCPSVMSAPHVTAPGLRALAALWR
ncbi:hypothetical protein [Nonomuraea sp. GTA35]|uniref:hypothetical protein n=1 Tax=Nonomuraea sp. GTA35 TaxID=1676746 RepID=UPI0035BFDD5C